MSDIALSWDGQVADLDLSGFDFVLDHDLQTPTLVALFSDRRAADADALPDAGGDRRGWWGDSYAAPGHLIGSRLWLLNRSRDVRDVPLRAREYVREGLGELVALGRALSVVATASVPRRDILALSVTVRRPELDPYEFTQEQAI